MTSAQVVETTKRNYLSELPSPRRSHDTMQLKFAIGAEYCACLENRQHGNEAENKALIKMSLLK